MITHEGFCVICRDWYEGDYCPCSDDGSAENYADQMNDERWCEEHE